MVKFIVNLFLSEIKVVFQGTEAEAFVMREKVPFLFNCAGQDMEVAVKRLFEKLAELQKTYLKVCLVRPKLEFDITAFSGDKESFKKEITEPLKRFGCRMAVLYDGSVRSILFE